MSDAVSPSDNGAPLLSNVRFQPREALCLFSADVWAFVIVYIRPTSLSSETFSPPSSCSFFFFFKYINSVLCKSITVNTEQSSRSKFLDAVLYSNHFPFSILQSFFHLIWLMFVSALCSSSDLSLSSCYPPFILLLHPFLFPSKPCASSMTSSASSSYFCRFHKLRLSMSHWC